MVLFAFKDDEVLQKLVARRNAKRNYFLVLTVHTTACDSKRHNYFTS